MSKNGIKARVTLCGGGSIVAIALGASLLGASAAAAQSSEATVSDVVVTGYRASVQSAVQTKRGSDTIVDVIKADDLASFPDANLAESIQRIPGVSITRDGGEGRQVTVRGLSGDFVRTTLNGVEAYSATTGSTLGQLAGVNRSRGFDFSTFASELFNSVSVAKSQSAEMDEGSLAATVNLETARPFDKAGFRAAAAAQVAYYDINRTGRPRLSGLISNTWNDVGSLGDMGALLSVAYSKRRATEDGYSDTSQSDYSDALNGFCGRATDDPNQAGSQVVNTSIPYVNSLSGSLTGSGRPANQCFSGKPSDPAAYSAINQAGIFLPRNPGLGRFELDQARLGATSSFQWRPNDTTEVVLDLVYSKFDQDRTDYALSLASNNRNVNGASATFPLFAGRVDTQIMDVHVNPTGLSAGSADANLYGVGQVDYMKLNNVDIKHIQEKAETTTQTHQYGLTFKREFTDWFRANLKFAHSGSDFDQPWDVLMSFDGFNKDGYSWDSRADVRRPLINYGYDVADPNNVTFTNAGTGLTPDIRIVQAGVKNTLKTAEINGELDLIEGITVKGGFSYKNFDFISTQQQRFFPNNSNPCTVSSTSNTALAGSSPAVCTGYRTFNFTKFATDFPGSAPMSQTLTDWGGSLNLPAGSVTSWVVPDVGAYIQNLDLLCNCANAYGDFTLNTVNALGSNRDLKEEDHAAYVQIDFDKEVMGMRMRGNTGLRWVLTDLTSNGFLSATQPVKATNRYNDLLPSFNLAVDVSPDVVARLAVAKVMARPGFGNLNPGGSVNTTFGAQSASIGNPFLDPYHATNYDLSVEWYPAPGSIVSGALFYKNIDSMIQTLATTEPFGNTGLPTTLLPANQDATTPYLVTRSRNTEGGYIEGLELNWQQGLSFLPGRLSNLGTQLNYTYVKSSVLYYLSAGTATVAPGTAMDDFPNVSTNSVNATLYYEEGGFQARVSVAYRDDYLVALPFKSEVPDGFGSYGTTNVDASASYQITPHVKLTFDALNLTDQAADQWSGKIRRAQRVYSKTGRQFFVGAAYTF